MGTITSSVLTSLYYRFGGWRRARMLEEEPIGQASDAGLAVPSMAVPEADEEAAEVVEAAKATA
jgi:hypothetical protein